MGCTFVNEYVNDSTRVKLLDIPGRKTKHHHLIRRPYLHGRDDSHARIISMFDSSRKCAYARNMKYRVLVDLPCSICKRMDRVHKSKGVCTACYRVANYKGKRRNKRPSLVCYSWEEKHAKESKTSYNSAHKWATRTFGKFNQCEFCHTTKATRFEWAMKTDTLSSYREDWYRLCKKCHIKYDADRLSTGRVLPSVPEPGTL